jgi:ubiquinone/menaquinone biosynthesis C-methylase UbiE
MALAQFAREYRTVRRAEGWGSLDGAYYRRLPFQDLTGRYTDIWRIRARSYQTFLQRVLVPLENPAGRALKVLDLGAGSGWLAYRLARRGHWVAAVDLLDDPLDGLGAVRHYATPMRPLLAEFDHLPLPDCQFDVAVFNASLHYSTHYLTTLRETLRVLRNEGTLVILDSPMYRGATSGMRMVHERQARFLSKYGFASNALPSEHFLTPARLDALAAELGIVWRLHRPGLDWRSRLGRAIGGVRARREPAQFPVIVGTCP